MRIWSLNPKYLDSKGLVALWRETLLAKNVFQGNTKGYINHPQLIRFKATNNPLKLINYYLENVYYEAISRGYSFDSSKFERENDEIDKINVTNGQLEFEYEHLLKKLYIRDKERFIKLKRLTKLVPHPMFRIIPGEIEAWEKL